MDKESGAIMGGIAALPSPPTSPITFVTRAEVPLEAQTDGCKQVTDEGDIKVAGGKGKEVHAVEPPLIEQQEIKIHVEEVVQKPDEVVLQTVEVVQMPDEVVKQTIEVVQKPDEVVKQTIEVVQKPDEVVLQTTEVVQKPIEVVQASDDVVQSNEEVEQQKQEIIQQTVEVVQQKVEVVQQSDPLKQQSESLIIQETITVQSEELLLKPEAEVQDTTVQPSEAEPVQGDAVEETKQAAVPKASYVGEDWAEGCMKDIRDAKLSLIEAEFTENTEESSKVSGSWVRDRRPALRLPKAVLHHVSDLTNDLRGAVNSLKQGYDHRIQSLKQLLGDATDEGDDLKEVQDQVTAKIAKLEQEIMDILNIYQEVLSELHMKTTRLSDDLDEARDVADIKNHQLRSEIAELAWENTRLKSEKEEISWEMEKLKFMEKNNNNVYVQSTVDQADAQTQHVEEETVNQRDGQTQHTDSAQ